MFTSFINVLKKPSTEVQTDAICFQIISLILFSMLLLFRSGTYYFVPVIILFVISTTIAIWKLKFEKNYGKFLMVSVATSSDSVFKNKKAVIEKGKTEVCELHLVRNVAKIWSLSREGKIGKLKIIKKSLEDVLTLRTDMDNSFYKDVEYITIRTNLKAFHYNFLETPDFQPRLSFFNQFMKFIVAINFSIISKKKFKNFKIEDIKLFFISIEKFRSEQFKLLIENEINSIDKKIKSGSRLVKI